MPQEIKKQDTSVRATPRHRDPFAEMRAEMERVFDTFLGRGFFGRPVLSSRAEISAVAPDVDIRENEKEIILEAELPGIDEKDIEVIVGSGVLSLKGQKRLERDEKKDTYHLVERSYGSFERSFKLPDSIDEDQIKADFNKGVLRVILPKRAEAAKATRTIPVGKS